jgi:hypothetical protein
MARTPVKTMSSSVNTVQSLVDAAFPRLSENQMQCVARCAPLETFAKGQALVEEEADDYPMFVIKSGEV